VEVEDSGAPSVFVCDTRRVGEVPAPGRQRSPSMIRHPHFDLHLHDAVELASPLGSAVVARETLSEWPLRGVQRIRTADGRTTIYKAQAEPTVEPQFYVAAHRRFSPLPRRCPTRTAPRALLEDVTAPRLSDLAVTVVDAPRVVEEVLGAIAGIGGELPALADLRSPPGTWCGCAHVSRPGGAGGARRVPARSRGGGDLVASASASPGVLDALAGEMGIFTATCAGKNVFIGADSAVRVVIDWQRPLYGPVALDRATLLESLGVDRCP